MRTTTIFAETHTSERANHVAYRLVSYLFSLIVFIWRKETYVTLYLGWTVYFCDGETWNLHWNGPTRSCAFTGRPKLIRLIWFITKQYSWTRYGKTSWIKKPYIVTLFYDISLRSVIGYMGKNVRTLTAWIRFCSGAFQLRNQGIFQDLEYGDVNQPLGRPIPSLLSPPSLPSPHPLSFLPFPS